ncbi:hypothetical protein [Paraburkholderia caledonica]|uniref:hypothetical protein n=1 Tax=Paraburkholderia caledonica TaxID=134536 RepID=UPI0038CDAFF2
MQWDDWALYDNSGDIPIVLELGGKLMKQQELFKAKNPDLRASLAAMQRAAEFARRTALQPIPLLSWCRTAN